MASIKRAMVPWLFFYIFENSKGFLILFFFIPFGNLDGGIFYGTIQGTTGRS
jgi:hypothetical protein